MSSEGKAKIKKKSAAELDREIAAGLAGLRGRVDARSQSKRRELLSRYGELDASRRRAMPEVLIETYPGASGYWYAVAWDGDHRLAQHSGYSRADVLGAMRGDTHLRNRKTKIRDLASWDETREGREARR